MFTKEDILAELADGKSIEAIAQNCADVLNAAKAQYDKDEAARKARALQKDKEEAAAVIVDEIFDYMDLFHPDFLSDEDLKMFRKNFDPAALVSAIDDTVKTIKAIPEIQAALKAVKKTPVRVNLSGNSVKAAEGAIDKFLRENNLF